MQGRSWMAALTVAAALFPSATFSVADDEVSQTTPVAPKGLIQTVKLELQIAGLGNKGCDVEIKPGHPGCKFKPISKHINLSGNGWGLFSVELKDVEILSADRDCTFAITIDEPGQPVRTTRRGLRIASTSEKDKTPTLFCYLNSPSRIAKAEKGTTTKR